MNARIIGCIALISLAFWSSASAEEKVFPVIDGMNLELSDSVQQVQVRAKSLSAGTCGVIFTLKDISTQFLAPPQVWSPWTDVGPGFVGKSAQQLGFSPICDVGAIAQVKFDGSQSIASLTASAFALTAEAEFSKEGFELPDKIVAEIPDPESAFDNKCFVGGCGKSPCPQSMRLHVGPEGPACEHYSCVPSLECIKSYQMTAFLNLPKLPKLPELKLPEIRIDSCTPWTTNPVYHQTVFLMNDNKDELRHYGVTNEDTCRSTRDAVMLVIAEKNPALAAVGWDLARCACRDVF